MATIRRVRVGATYHYDPVPLDVIDGRTDLEPGALVRVVNLPGCPSANVMGHCYVADPTTGRFVGMVCCNSLVPRKEWKARAAAK